MPMLFFAVCLLRVVVLVYSSVYDCSHDYFFLIFVITCSLTYNAVPAIRELPSHGVSSFSRFVCARCLNAAVAT